MNKWIVRAAVLTGVLGFAGALYVLVSLVSERTGKQETAKKYLASSVDDRPAVLQKTSIPKIEKKAEIPAEPVVDKIPESIVKYIEAEKTTPATEEKAASKPAEPVAKNDISQSKGKDTLVKRTAASVKNRTLSEDEIDRILNKMDDAIFKAKSKSNCVRLVITQNGNNRTAASQIESALRQENYSIAGRQIIHDDIKGTRVNATGKCISLTIGSF